MKDYSHLDFCNRIFTYNFLEINDPAIQTPGHNVPPGVFMPPGPGMVQGPGYPPPGSSIAQGQGYPSQPYVPQPTQQPNVLPPTQQFENMNIQPTVPVPVPAQPG